MMKKIKFLSTQKVEAQGEISQVFKVGEVYELSIASARRWVRRNVATEVLGSVKPAPKKRKPAATKPIVAEKKVETAAEFTRKPPITSAPSASKSDDSDTGGRPVPNTK
jgi:hypothetical protein